MINLFKKNVPTDEAPDIDTNLYEQNGEYFFLDGENRIPFYSKEAHEELMEGLYAQKSEARRELLTKRYFPIATTIQILIIVILLHKELPAILVLLLANVAAGLCVYAFQNREECEVYSLIEKAEMCPYEEILDGAIHIEESNENTQEKEAEER